MEGDDLTPEQKEGNRRLLGQLVGWLMFRGRRPGMLGIATAISGRTSNGKAQLRRQEDFWVLSESAGDTAVELPEVRRLLGTRDFRPATIDVVPDLAELLFQEAVHQAETSLLHVEKAGDHLAELATADEDRWFMPFTLSTSVLDRAVRSAMASIVLAVAAGEAQVNSWASSDGGWLNGEDRLSVAEKCAVLAARAGHPVDLGRQPYQQLVARTRRRNGLVHSEHVAEAVPAVGKLNWAAGSTISFEESNSCDAVRRSFLDLARRLNATPPSYLQYSPASGPKDEQAWRTASIMTGVRPDPDFLRPEGDPAD